MAAQRWSCILVALFALAAWPAGAAAADERRSAQRFADAALRAQVAVQAQKAEIEARSAPLAEAACLQAVGAAPTRVRVAVLTIYLEGAFGAVFEPTLPALRTLVTDLEAIPTRDRALRSGRDAWRRSVATVEAIPRRPDACGEIVAWRSRRWSAEGAPQVDEKNLESKLDTRVERRLERKFRRAERRMRRLGVSRGAARRFRGTTFFKGIEGTVLSSTSTGESATTAP